jgi:hypothetical protein
MSAAFVHVWQYGIQCDHPGCKATLWRMSGSEAGSWNTAQRDAKAAGWSVASDRLVSNRDLCKEHAWPVAGAV